MCSPPIFSKLFYKWIATCTNGKYGFIRAKNDVRNSTRELLRSSILSNLYKWFTELTIQTSLPQPAIWNFSRKRLTLNLKTVKIWCTVNRLSINFSKTNFTILSTAVYVCTTWMKVLLLLLKQHMAVCGLSLRKWIKECISLYFGGGGLIWNILSYRLWTCIG